MNFASNKQQLKDIIYQKCLESASHDIDLDRAVEMLQLALLSDSDIIEYDHDDPDRFLDFYKEHFPQAGKGLEDSHEAINDYRTEGYFPTFVGEVIEGKYVVVAREGYDEISTSWIARDFSTDSYVRLKILKGKQRLIQAILRELEYQQKVLQYISEQDWANFLANSRQKSHSRGFNDQVFNKILNAFDCKGVYGTFGCIVYELAGVPLSRLLAKSYRTGMGRKLTTRITCELLQLLHLLNDRCGLVKVNLSPKNIFLCPSFKSKMTDHNVNEYLKFLQKNIDLFRLQQQDYLVQTPHLLAGSQKDPKSQGPAQGMFSGEEDAPGEEGREFALNSDNQKLLGEFLQKCEPGRWLYEEGFEFEFLSQSDIDDGNFHVRIGSLTTAEYVSKANESSQRLPYSVYIPPEAILGLSVDKRFDIWALGCTVYEIFSGKSLFVKKKDAPRSAQLAHLLAQMNATVKPFPKLFYKLGRKSREFFDRDKLADSQLPTSLPDDKPPLLLDSRDELTSFLAKCLEYHAYKREQPAKLLQHEWLRKAGVGQKDKIRFFTQMPTSKKQPPAQPFCFAACSDEEEVEHEQMMIFVPEEPAAPAGDARDSGKGKKKPQLPAPKRVQGLQPGASKEARHVWKPQSLSAEEEEDQPNLSLNLLTKTKDDFLRHAQKHLLVDFKQRFAFVRSGL